MIATAELTSHGGVLQIVGRKQTASARWATNITTHKTTFDAAGQTQQLWTWPWQSNDNHPTCLCCWNRDINDIWCMMHSCMCHGSYRAWFSYTSCQYQLLHTYCSGFCRCMWSKQKLKIYTRIIHLVTHRRKYCTWLPTLVMSLLPDCHPGLVMWLPIYLSVSSFAFVLYPTSVNCAQIVPHFLPLSQLSTGPILMLLQSFATLALPHVYTTLIMMHTCLVKTYARPKLTAV